MDETPRTGTTVALGRTESTRSTIMWALAGLWAAFCIGKVAQQLLTVTSPSISAFFFVALWSALATPAVGLVLAAWRHHARPTTVERVGDDLVITSPAFLTAPLVVPVEDVAEVRHGQVGPPGETKGWPALSAGPDPEVGLLLARPTPLPAREPAPWTGHEMPRRQRLAVAVLMTSADPRTAAEAIGTLVGLPAVEVRDARGS